MSQFYQSVSSSTPGIGDVTGPASSTDGDIVLFNGATGKIIKDSGVNASGIITINTTGELTGGGTVALGGTLNLNVPSGGFTWNDVSGAFVSTKSNGYFITAAASTTLPAGAQGDTIEYILDTSGGNLVVTANAGQTIRIGSQVSSIGGTITSTSIGSTVELIFRASDSVWISGDNNGSWNFT